MYAHGYRIARLPASLILSAIRQTASGIQPLAIEIGCETNDEYAKDGHLNLRNGKHYASMLADPANGLVELSEAETFGEPT